MAKGVKLDEGSIPVGVTGKRIVFPAHPEECSYVRVIDPKGKEIAYWDSLEWEDEPVEVMGAIMGAAQNGVGKEDKKRSSKKVGNNDKLDDLAKSLAAGLARKINAKAPLLDADVPYKCQYVLEEIIKLLQQAV